MNHTLKHPLNLVNRTNPTRKPLHLGIFAILITVLLSACGGTDSNTSTVVTDADRAALGRRIFTDNNLSEPRGTACAACHSANVGFAGNHGSTIGVALGSQSTSLGLRNSMTNRYIGFIPEFSFETINGVTEAVGGFFWDGRANNAVEQAQGPFLNSLEMNNSSKQMVINKVAASNYADEFKRIYGATIFNDVDTAYVKIAEAITAFELSTEMQPFSSKYDAMIQGKTTFTAAEARGLALFQDVNKGNCAGCHLMKPNTGNPIDSPFSEYSYYATGVPRNPSIPRNSDPSFYDLGVCGPDRTAPTLPNTVAPGVTISNFCGKFRMPSLRNVAERNVFMHNGALNNLHDVVEFYSTRISDPSRWYGANVASNDLPAQYLGNIETVKAPFNRTASQGAVFTNTEVNDLLAFLRTLSDGFVVP